jgi:hypothetical protein
MLANCSTRRSKPAAPSSHRSSTPSTQSPQRPAADDPVVILLQGHPHARIESLVAELERNDLHRYAHLLLTLTKGPPKSMEELEAAVQAIHGHGDEPARPTS